MKLKSLFSILALAAASTAAWGHPGHGAEGLYHHLVDLLALSAVGVILAAVWAGRRSGGKDHE